MKMSADALDRNAMVKRLYDMIRGRHMCDASCPPCRERLWADIEAALHEYESQVLSGSTHPGAPTP